MSCWFVLYFTIHILIKAKWTCPPGLQHKWLNCLLQLICLMNTTPIFLLLSQAAMKASSCSCIYSLLLPRVAMSEISDFGLQWVLLQHFPFLIHMLHIRKVASFKDRGSELVTCSLSWILPPGQFSFAHKVQ